MNEPMRHHARVSPSTHLPICCAVAACLLFACTGDKAAPKDSTDAPGQAKKTGVHASIQSKAAGMHLLSAKLELVGSVVYNPDHVASVGPLVSGRVATLEAKNGTSVKRGQLLGEVESPEAGQAMAQFITAHARSRAAQAQWAREKDLAKKHITSARDLEVAEAQAAQAEAEYRAAEELLQALGLEGQGSKSTARGRVPLRSPIDGVVISRFVTLGQAVERGTDAFLVADLSQLWVELEIYEKDLERVHVGQEVELRTDSLPGQMFAAKVAFVEPIVNVKTRTSNTRLELNNTEHLLRPGQFVTARLAGGGSAVSREVLAVERASVQSINGHDVLFVDKDGTYEPRPVTLGLHDDAFVEVIAGLSAGEKIVVQGAFLLKANLSLR